MNKSVNTLIVLVMGGLCLSYTFLMPWAEAGLTGKADAYPPWLREFLQKSNIAATYNLEGSKDLASRITKDLKEKGTETGFGDYAYAFFLALALITSGIGIAAIGKEDAEEKTLLPAKK